jgi:hypothetical protein
MSKYRWVVTLTRSQHMAMIAFLADYLRQPGRLMMSVDTFNDQETTPEELLGLVTEAAIVSTEEK